MGSDLLVISHAYTVNLKQYLNMLRACPCCVCIDGLHQTYCLAVSQVRPGSNTTCNLRPATIAAIQFQHACNSVTPSKGQQRLDYIKRAGNNSTTDLLHLPRSWQIYRRLYKATSGYCALMYAPIKYTSVGRHALVNKGDTTEHNIHNPQQSCITHGLCLLWT